MALYTRVDATDPIGGQPIMVLVPAADSSVPYNASNPTRVVLYAHGVGESQSGLLDEALKAGVVTELLTAGYILAGSNQHGDNWGSQQGVDDLVALEKYVRDNYNVSGVCLWAQSMGGMSGLLCAAQGKFEMLGLLATYPVCSLSNLYGLGTYTAAINSAHAITGSGSGTYANRTRGLDPALLTGFSWRHMPMRIYASTGDTVVPRASNADALFAIVDGSARENALVACTGDHGDPSHFQPSDYRSFFDRCFATRNPSRRPAATKTVAVTLTSDGTTALPSLTGLKWAWYDQPLPNSPAWPTDFGSAESTDGSGQLVIPVHTSLAAGGVGRLVVSDSDGTTTQSPAPRAFDAPVQVT